MAKDRFRKERSEVVAFVNVVIDGNKATDTKAISAVVDAIEAGQFTISCYLNKDGEPTVMITPTV